MTSPSTPRIITDADVRLACCEVSGDQSHGDTDVRESNHHAWAGLVAGVVLIVAVGFALRALPG